MLVCRRGVRYHRFCLPQVSSGWKNTYCDLLEKGLNIESITSFLQCTALVSRAKSARENFLLLFRRGLLTFTHGSGSITMIASSNSELRPSLASLRNTAVLGTIHPHHKLCIKAAKVRAAGEAELGHITGDMVEEPSRKLKLLNR